MIVVVSDTSPIRSLAHLNYLHLLAGMFDQVLVPPAVADELENPRPRFAPVRLDQIPVVRIQAPQDREQVERLRESLDSGEAEAIVLALEVQAARILIDEKAGRNTAAARGLTCMGVFGVLLEGKQRGLVKSVRPLIDSLEDELGFFLSDSARAEIVRHANE